MQEFPGETLVIPAVRSDRDLSSTGNKLDRCNLVPVTGVTVWNAVDLKLLLAFRPFSLM